MKFIYISILLLASAAPAQASLNLNEVFKSSQPSSVAEKNIQLAMMCFSSGEQISGMNKICYYNCGGSQAAITVSSASLCPLTIDN